MPLYGRFRRMAPRARYPAGFPGSCAAVAMVIVRDDWGALPSVGCSLSALGGWALFSPTRRVETAAHCSPFGGDNGFVFCACLGANVELIHF